MNGLALCGLPWSSLPSRKRPARMLDQLVVRSAELLLTAPITMVGYGTLLLETALII